METGIILTWIVIALPFLGAFSALILSQMYDSLSNEGRTIGWILVILNLLPVAIITLLLLWHMHFHHEQFFEWLPNIYVGIRINELSVGFACLVNCLSVLLGFYSINYIKGDTNTTNYWFFFLLTQGGMLFAIFSNNLLWLFFGFAIASIGGFFLISHWRNKSGKEGEKVSNAAIRYFIINFIADIFLIIGFALISKAFETISFDRLTIAWSRHPKTIIGGSSGSTRLIIEIFVVLGALIKSAQFPILLWPLASEEKDCDVAKAPLPLSSYMISVTLGNIGLFILSVFFPLFSSKGLEVYFETELFNSTPFVMMGWFAIITVIICLVVLFTSKSINRIMNAASLFQVSFTILALGSANELGYLASIYHLILSSAASVAMMIIFGMVIESLRVKQISRVSGLRTRFPILQILGFISILSYVGMFPFSTYFSRDMIFEALRTSIVPSSTALLVLAIIASVIVVFALGKSLMKVLFGELDQEYSIRPLNLTSIISEILVLLWSCFAGFILIIVDTPTPRFFRGFLQQDLNLAYDFPIFSNWAISMVMLGIVPLVLVGTYFIYRDGEGKIFEKIRNFKGTVFITSIINKGFYLMNIGEYIVLRPLGFLGNYASWTRMKAPAASIIWAILAFVVLITTLYVLGGT